ncbi:MAG: KAP family NTPase [Myxococcota bacterium]|nr:KAP family NTPase [Myxococcota bacterium]
MIDPGVELLTDIPIAGVSEDLLARTPIAQRIVELACAEPLAASRAVGLVGGSGVGKTSILAMVAELLAARADVAVVWIDAAAYAGAAQLLEALIAHLTEFFAAAGVVDTTDSVRDRLARYGGFVANVAKIAGVKVDLEGAMRRSPEAVRKEMIEMTQEVRQRIVVVIDHVDRYAEKEMAASFEALRHYATIPYVTMVLAVDRRSIARRLADDDDRDPEIVERLLQVELSVPPPDRILIARIVAGGLARTATRCTCDIDDVLRLFDPDHGGALGLDLIQTPRDAKRAANALAAALPLTESSYSACLDLLLRLFVPSLDGPRLDARLHLRDVAGRQALLAELESSIRLHRRAGAARAALRGLFQALETPTESA